MRVPFIDLIDFRALFAALFTAVQVGGHVLDTLKIIFVFVVTAAIIGTAAYWMRHGYFWEVTAALGVLCLWDWIKYPEFWRWR